MKRHHELGNSDKGTHLIGAGLQLTGLVLYWYGDTQADIVPEKELRVLHLDLQAAEGYDHTRPSLSI